MAPHLAPARLLQNCQSEPLDATYDEVACADLSSIVWLLENRNVTRAQRKKKERALRLRPTVPAAVTATASVMAAVTMAAGAPAPILPAAAGRATATGPKTPEGRAVSRANALKHGLTAKTVLLPNENPDEIQAKADSWRQTYNPQGTAEEELVDQIALCSLRLKRIAAAEETVLAAQFHGAELQWDLEQSHKLTKFRRMLHRDRITAILNLRSFGAGVSWLLARWRILEAAFNRSHCWTTVAVIREAVLHRGMHDERVSSGYELAHLAISCTEDHQNKKALVHFLENYHDEASAHMDSPDTMKQFLDSMASYITDEFQSRAGVRELSVIEARRTLRTWLDRQIADLKELDRHFREADALARAAATALVLVLDDTPKHRLLMRYMRSAELAQSRAMRMLAVLQKERKEEAERGEGVSLPNELSRRDETDATISAAESCVSESNSVRGTEQINDDASMMTLDASHVASQPLEVAARVENGV